MRQLQLVELVLRVLWTRLYWLLVTPVHATGKNHVADSCRTTETDISRTILVETAGTSVPDVVPRTSDSLAFHTPVLPVPELYAPTPRPCAVSSMMQGLCLA